MEQWFPTIGGQHCAAGADGMALRPLGRDHHHRAGHPDRRAMGGVGSAHRRLQDDGHPTQPREGADLLWQICGHGARQRILLDQPLLRAQEDEPARRQHGRGAHQGERPQRQPDYDRPGAGVEGGGHLPRLLRRRGRLVPQLRGRAERLGPAQGGQPLCLRQSGQP